MSALKTNMSIKEEEAEKEKIKQMAIDKRIRTRIVREEKEKLDEEERLKEYIKDRNSATPYNKAATILRSNSSLNPMQNISSNPVRNTTDSIEKITGLFNTQLGIDETKGDISREEVYGRMYITGTQESYNIDYVLEKANKMVLGGEPLSNRRLGKGYGKMYDYGLA